MFIMCGCHGLNILIIVATMVEMARNGVHIYLVDIIIDGDRFRSEISLLFDVYRTQLEPVSTIPRKQTGGLEFMYRKGG